MIPSEQAGFATCKNENLFVFTHIWRGLGGSSARVNLQQVFPGCEQGHAHTMKTMQNVSNEKLRSDSADNDAITRLRATRAEFESYLTQSGSRAGKRFATVNPDFSQLRRLQRWAAASDAAHQELSGFMELAEILTNEDGSERELQEAMRDQYGSDIDEDGWINAFVDAALSHFAELEAKL